MLAAVLDQLVDDVGVASDEGGQRPAGADRPQLVVVADEHQFGPGGLDAGGQGDQVGVVGHAHLVEDDHGALVEGQPVVVEPPQQAGQRPGLAHGRLSCPGCGPPGRRWRSRPPGSRAASKAAATTWSRVVLPAPATPTTSSAPRPELQMLSAAWRCSADRAAPIALLRHA